MSEDGLQYVVRMLKDRNLRKVAENVGLSYMTVYKIAKGINTTPSFSTVKKLAEYFGSEQ